MAAETDKYTFIVETLFNDKAKVAQIIKEVKSPVIVNVSMKINMTQVDQALDKVSAKSKDIQKTIEQTQFKSILQTQLEQTLTKMRQVGVENSKITKQLEAHTKLLASQGPLGAKLVQNIQQRLTANKQISAELKIQQKQLKNMIESARDFNQVINSAKGSGIPTGANVRGRGAGGADFEFQKRLSIIEKAFGLSAGQGNFNRNLSGSFRISAGGRIGTHEAISLETIVNALQRQGGKLLGSGSGSKVAGDLNLRARLESLLAPGKGIVPGAGFTSLDLTGGNVRHILDTNLKKFIQQRDAELLAQGKAQQARQAQLYKEQGIYQIPLSTLKNQLDVRRRGAARKQAAAVQSEAEFYKLAKQFGISEGTASDLKRFNRLQELQSQLPLPMQTAFTSVYNNPEEIEKAIHIAEKYLINQKQAEAVRLKTVAQANKIQRKIGGQSLALTATTSQAQAAINNAPNFKYLRLEAQERLLNPGGAVVPITNETEYFNRSLAYQQAKDALRQANKGTGGRFGTSKTSTFTGTERQNLERANKALDQLTTEELKNPAYIKAIADKYKISPQNFGKLDVKGAGSFLRGSRLANPETLIQLGFAGAFGGPASLTGALIGGATKFGAGGAVFGSTAAQAIMQTLFEPVKQIFIEFSEQFKEAGLAFNRSILGIAAVNQASSTFVGPNGEALPIGQQLSLQAGRARQIQLAARSRLLPLGIAGQTEATFVQGITSALSQRGFNASPEQIAKISEGLGGAIQAQRPQLLENTQLLLRDIQDVLGGGPQAKRTILSQLIRPSLGGITEAKSTEDIVKAVQRLQGFVEAAKGLDNPIVQLNKLAGALDLLKTNAGDKLLDALTPAIKRFLDVLDPATESGKKINQLAENLGTALGEISGSFTDFNNKLLQFASGFKDTIPKFTSGFELFQKQVPGILDSIRGIATTLLLLNSGSILGFVGKGIGGLGKLGLGAGLLGQTAGIGSSIRKSLLGFAGVAGGLAGSNLLKGGAGFAQALNGGVPNTLSPIGTALSRGAAGTAIGLGQGALGLGAEALGAIAASVVPVAVALLIGGPLLKEIINAVGDSIAQEADEKVNATQSFYAARGQAKQQAVLQQRLSSRINGAIAALGLEQDASEFEKSLSNLPETRKSDIQEQIDKLFEGVSFGNREQENRPGFIGPKQAILEPIPNKVLTLYNALGEANQAAIAQKQSFLLPGAPDLFSNQLELESGRQKLLDLGTTQEAIDKIKASRQEISVSPEERKAAEQALLKAKSAQQASAGNLSQAEQDRKLLAAALNNPKAAQAFRSRHNVALSAAQLSSLGIFGGVTPEGIAALLTRGRSSAISAQDLTIKDLVSGKLISKTQAERFGEDSKVYDLLSGLTSSISKLKPELDAATEAVDKQKAALDDLNKKAKDAAASTEEYSKLLSKQKIFQEQLNQITELKTKLNKIELESISKTVDLTGGTAASRQIIAESEFNKLIKNISVIKADLDKVNKAVEVDKSQAYQYAPGFIGPTSRSKEDFETNRTFNEQRQATLTGQLNQLNKLTPGQLESVVNAAGADIDERLSQLSKAGAPQGFSFVGNNNPLLLQQEQLQKRITKAEQLLNEPGSDAGTLINIIGKLKSEFNNLTLEIHKSWMDGFTQLNEKLKESSEAFDNLHKGISAQFDNTVKFTVAIENAQDRLQEFNLGRRGRELAAINEQVGLGQQYKQLTGGYYGISGEALSALENPDIAKSLQRQTLEEQINKSNRDLNALPKTEQEQEEALQNEIKTNTDALASLTDAIKSLRDAYSKANELGAPLPPGVFTQQEIDAGITPKTPFKPNPKDYKLVYPDTDSDNKPITQFPKPPNPFTVNSETPPPAEGPRFTINGIPVPPKYKSGTGFTVEGDQIPPKYGSSSFTANGEPVYPHYSNPFDPIPPGTKFKRIGKEGMLIPKLGDYEDNNREFTSAAPLRGGIAGTDDDYAKRAGAVSVDKEGYFRLADGRPLVDESIRKDVDLGSQLIRSTRAKKSQIAGTPSLSEFYSLMKQERYAEADSTLKKIEATTRLSGDPDQINMVNRLRQNLNALSSSSDIPTTFKRIGKEGILQPKEDFSRPAPGYDPTDPAETKVMGKVLPWDPGDIELGQSWFTNRKIGFSNPSNTNMEPSAPELAGYSGAFKPELTNAGTIEPSTPELTGYNSSFKPDLTAGGEPPKTKRDRIAVLLVDPVASAKGLQADKSQGLYDEVIPISNETDIKKGLQGLKSKYPNVDFDIFTDTHGNHGSPQGFKLEQKSGKDKYVHYGKIEEYLANAGIGPENCSLTYGGCNAATGYYNANKSGQLSDTAKKYAGVTFGSNAMNYEDLEQSAMTPMMRFASKGKYKFGKLAEIQQPRPNEIAAQHNDISGADQIKAFSYIQRYRHSDPDLYEKLGRIVADTPDISVEKLQSVAKRLSPISNNKLSLLDNVTFSDSAAGTARGSSSEASASDISFVEPKATTIPKPLDEFTKNLIARNKIPGYRAYDVETGRKALRASGKGIDDPIFEGGVTYRQKFGFVDRNISYPATSRSAAIKQSLALSRKGGGVGGGFGDQPLSTELPTTTQESLAHAREGSPSQKALQDTIDKSETFIGGEGNIQSIGKLSNKIDFSKGPNQDLLEKPKQQSGNPVELLQKIEAHLAKMETDALQKQFSNALKQEFS